MIYLEITFSFIHLTSLKKHFSHIETVEGSFHLLTPHPKCSVDEPDPQVFALAEPEP
jgi:hypothetical protein